MPAADVPCALLVRPEPFISPHEDLPSMVGPPPTCLAWKEVHRVKKSSHPIGGQWSWRGGRPGGPARAIHLSDGHCTGFALRGQSTTSVVNGHGGVVARAALKGPPTKARGFQPRERYHPTIAS